MKPSTAICNQVFLKHILVKIRVCSLHTIRPYLTVLKIMSQIISLALRKYHRGVLNFKMVKFKIRAALREKDDVFNHIKKIVPILSNYIFRY